MAAILCPLFQRRPFQFRTQLVFAGQNQPVFAGEQLLTAPEQAGGGNLSRALGQKENPQC